MRTLKLAIFDYYPMVNKDCKIPTWKAHNGCTMPGMGLELIKMFTDYLNWTIEAHVKPWAEYDDSLENLTNGTYDLYALTYEKTLKREEVFDFSDHLYESTSRLIVRRAENSLTSIFDFFAVYNWRTWLVMGAALLFFIVIGALTRWVEYRLELRDTPRLTDVAWRMLRLQLIQYQKIDYRLMAGSFSLLVFAFLQVTIIISLYQSWIISSVVRTRNIYPFNVDDLATLLKERRYKFVSNDKHEWFMEEINGNSESPYFELRKAMNNDSFKLVKNEEQILELVNRGDAIAVEQDDISLSFSVRNWCELTHMPSPFHDKKKYFMFRKGSLIRDEINRAIRAQRMLVEKTHRKYVNFRRPSKCQKHTNGPKALSIKPYFGVFVLFLLGMFAGGFVFGGEMVSAACRHTGQPEGSVGGVGMKVEGFERKVGSFEKKVAFKS